VLFEPVLTLRRRDEQGNNGIASIFGLLGQFLSPTFSEPAGIFVGDLIMHMFRKAGSAIGPVLPDLSRAMVERLAVAKMPSFSVVSSGPVELSLTSHQQE
jgi:hypothetical protein